MMRYRFGDLAPHDIPKEPGCYLFWNDDQCFYIGLGGSPKKKSTLRSRLEGNRGQGHTISGSQFRRNVAEHLGFGGRDEFKRRENRIARKLTEPERVELNAFAADLEIEWVLCGRDETAEVKHQLIAEHRPLMNHDGVSDAPVGQ